MLPATSKRLAAIGLALAAAALLVVAAFGNRWLASPDSSQTEGFGLLSLDVCHRGECRAPSHFAVVEELDREIDRIIEDNKTLAPNDQRAIPKRPWSGFPVVGVITFIMALTAAAALVVGAVLALARQRRALPVMPTTVAFLALALGLITGCVFVATKPVGFGAAYASAAMRLLANLGVGWTFIAFGGGVVAGLGAVFPLNKQIRPIDDDLGEASATMSWGISGDAAH